VGCPNRNWRVLHEIYARNGYFWKGEVILVPEILVNQVIARYHSHPISGHFGVSLIARKYTHVKYRFFPHLIHPTQCTHPHLWLVAGTPTDLGWVLEVTYISHVSNTPYATHTLEIQHVKIPLQLLHSHLASPTPCNPTFSFPP